MTITAITIENFKGIREPVRVELKPITLLFGPNSAGKSTIVQALHYAREIFERQNLNPDRTLLGGESIDLGGFESLVHKHDLRLPIKLGFELDLNNEDLPIYNEGEVVESLGSVSLDLDVDSRHVLDIISRVNKSTIEIIIRYSEQFLKPYIEKYNVSANGDVLLSVNSSPDGKQVYIDKINWCNPIFLKGEGKKEKLIEDFKTKRAETESTDPEEIEIPEGFMELIDSIFINSEIKHALRDYSSPINLLDQISPLPNWGKNLSVDRSLWEDNLDIGAEENYLRILSSLVVGPGDLVRDGLRKLCYIGPLRDVPKRGHKPATSPEESRWANGLAAYDTLFFSDDVFIDKVNDWLTQEEGLNSGYSVEVKQFRELEIDNPFMLAVLQGRILDEDMDLKEGLLNLPVKRRLLIRDEARNIELEPQDIGVGISQVLPVVVAALHRKTGIVAIEQPELHIHPAFQVALGDLFIEQVKENPDLNFILETHSEHLLLRFLRRIRETYNGDLPSETLGLSPKEMSIYYIETADDQVKVSELKISKDGDSSNKWPIGFFEERNRELY